MPLLSGSSPSAPAEEAAPYLVLGTFSEILVSATLVGTLAAVVSTVQVRLAGVASGLPAASVALTSKVWVPLLSPS